MSPNLKAFLDMIAVSEGTQNVPGGDGGYKVLVGGTLFHEYHDHPRTVVRLRPNLSSSAAGRYQILMRNFDVYKAQLGLPDFSPESQDRIAEQMIREQRAMPDVLAGRFDIAIEKCKNIWASLPGAGYGQHENDLAHLRDVYVRAGGDLA